MQLRTMLELNIITTLALHYEPAYYLSSFVIGFILDFSPTRNKILSQIHQKILLPIVNNSSFRKNVPFVQSLKLEL
jgi:hypothetical protein